MAFKKYSGGFDHQPKVNCPKCGKLYQYWKDDSRFRCLRNR